MNTRIQSLKDFIRQPYAFPGGYPKILVMGDGETICPACARAEYRQISDATRNQTSRDWAVMGCDIHYEGDPVECAHCGKLTESAYGNPDE